MVDPDKAMEVARRAVDKACEYFDIKGWDIDLSIKRLEDDTRGCIDKQVAYLRVWISIDASQADDLEAVWRTTAHEVAHIALCEVDILYHGAKKLMNDYDKQESLDFFHELAAERTTVKLERMFMRDCPYPGDEEFAVK